MLQRNAVIFANHSRPKSTKTKHPCETDTNEVSTFAKLVRPSSQFSSRLSLKLPNFCVSVEIGFPLLSGLRIISHHLSVHNSQLLLSGLSISPLSTLWAPSARVYDNNGIAKRRSVTTIMASFSRGLSQWEQFTIACHRLSLRQKYVSADS